MAQDEGCFGRINSLRRAWAPEHVRPQVPRQIVREYTYVYAAVDPKDGRITFLILPYTNTDMMNIFLKQVSEEFSSYFIVMQQRMVGLLTQVDAGLARQVAEGLGLPVPKGPEQPINQGVPPDADQKKYQGNRESKIH